MSYRVNVLFMLVGWWKIDIVAWWLCIRLLMFSFVYVR